MTDIKIDNEAAAVRSADGEEFYAILAWKGIMTSPIPNAPLAPVVLRYKCKDARPIGISKYLKTFIYFCPVFNTWDIHEVVTGMKLEGGLTISDAVKKTIAMLDEYAKNNAEAAFFKQMRIMGASKKCSLIDWDTAMSYLTAGEAEYQVAANRRREQMQRRPDQR